MPLLNQPADPMKSSPLLRLALACAALTSTAGASQATVLDLGSSGSGSLGGAFFATSDTGPAGTGVFDPFLSIQNNPDGQGYNGTNNNFDTKRVPQWNHE